LKRNTVRVATGLLAVLMLAITFGVGCAPQKEAPIEKTVFVGYIGDFSGPSALASGRLWTCAQEFFKWANDTNYLPGVKVEWTEEDDHYDPGQVPLAYRKIMANDPMVLFTMRSATAAVLKPLVDRDRVPVLAFTGSVAMAQEPPGFVFVGSFVPEIAFNCFLNYVADVWTEERPCRVASMSWDTDDCTQHIKSGVATAAALGIDFKEEYAEIAPPGTMDMTTYLIRIKELNPDYVFMAMNGPASGSAIKTMVSMGMDPAKAVYIVMSGAGMYEELSAVAGEENTYGATLVMADYSYSIKTEDQERIRMLMEGTDYGWDARYHVNALSFYSSCKILYEGMRIAIEDVGLENLDREAIYDALQKIQNFDAGVSLPITYGPDDRLAVQSCYIYEIGTDSIAHLKTDKVYNWPQKWGPDVY